MGTDMKLPAGSPQVSVYYYPAKQEQEGQE